MTDPFAIDRERMVAHLAARGVDDARVLNAMRAVPRHLFVPAALRAHAYDDRPLPIGAGQTISQPLVVALTAQLCALGPDDVALEVGAGSGYQAAVLAQLCRRVYALEIRPELAARARTNLLAAGVDNVVVGAGDGGHGWPEHAPYDAIAVAAAARTVPPPLVDQLADGGRLVIPLGAPDLQQLVRIVRRGDELERTEHGPVRFVAFVGDFG